ncbi:class I SAM-dependent methyltransferase [Methanobrevibacter filiformis]|uniref:Ribosomal RNA large subunit methyltransferase I n=1 Tax=Methanobrevibacter filiformis TaxID=55758 RepID=A0A166EZM6_9EURY|nr:class I SAM-dependent methyltransferase family protein [Methanobrevibacter filiformis]KZX17172.1 ribosomal RNA large subunit methyltransferase I [Methanobrevibacter filiformis]
MIAIKVELKYTNELRKTLIEKQTMNMNYKIKTDEDYGYIPIKNIADDVKKDIEDELNKKFNHAGKNDSNKITIEIIDTELEQIKKEPRSLKEHLKGKLNNEEIENLKKSFDIIGDIVILEIPEELQNQKYAIAKAAIDFTKRRSIFAKKSPIEGVTRTRKLEYLIGEDDSTTIHKEHDVRLSLDVKEVYFSPRLASERKRISDQVEEGEAILDMFAGIGPFPILIAKKNNVKIYAVDINKKAVECMEENIKINKLKGEVIAICGDINEVAKEFKEKNIKFDRIIMNLPGTAYKFLDLAISLLNSGGVVHYYEFSDNYDQGISRIKESSSKLGKEVSILSTRKVKSISPKEWHISVSAKIE